MTQNEAPNPPFMPFNPNTVSPGMPPQTAEAPAESGPKRKRKAAPAAPAEPKRRRAAAAKPGKSPRFDLQTILRVANSLKEADQPLFEKVLGDLSALPKGSRVRVLKALNEVFG